MIEVTIGGHLCGEREVSRPSPLRSSLRGATAGSREVGSASFTVYHIEGTRPSWLSMGAEVRIELDGVPHSFGVIDTLSGAEPPRAYKTMVTTKEAGGRLNDLLCGMPLVATQPNPELEVWLLEPKRIVQQPNNRGYFRGGVKVFEILPAATQFTGGLPPDPARLGYRKEQLFDSYHYSAHDLNADRRAGRRTMQWDELPAATILEQLRGLCAVQGLSTGGAAVDLSNDRGEVKLICQQAGGEMLLPDFLDTDPDARQLPAGLCTRSWDGHAQTFAWAQRVGEHEQIDNGDTPSPWNPIELSQVVNHSLVKKLGRIDFPFEEIGPGERNGVSWLFPWFDEHNPDGGAQALHPDGVGPFVVTPLSSGLWPTIVAFYWVTAYPTIDRDGKEVYRSRALVLEVDLRQVGDQSGEVLIARPVYLEKDSLHADEPYAWVIMDRLQGYALNNAAGGNPLRQTESIRSDGIYQWSGGAPLRWEGDLLLGQTAIDYQGQNPKDVVRGLALVNAAEWWIDGTGVLRLEPLDRTPRTVTVENGLYEQTQGFEGERPPDYSDEDFAGIPLSDLYRLELNRELKARITAQAAGRRTTKFWPPNYNLNLGAALHLNGTSRGRIVAIEAAGWPMVEVEVET